MNKSPSIVACMMAGLIIMTGCATKYRPRTMPTLYTPPHYDSQLAVSTKPLTDLDCKTYFDRRIVAKGYQPIQVSIKNTSKETYVLNGDDIDLPLEDALNVSNRVHRSMVKRVAGWGFLGLYCFPLLFYSAYEGWNAFNANKEMDRDFDLRSINPHDQIIIGPHATINRVMFVATENYRTNFDINFTHKKSGDRLTVAL